MRRPHPKQFVGSGSRSPRTWPWRFGHTTHSRQSLSRPTGTLREGAQLKTDPLSEEYGGVVPLVYNGDAGVDHGER